VKGSRRRAPSSSGYTEARSSRRCRPPTPRSPTAATWFRFSAPTTEPREHDLRRFPRVLELRVHRFLDEDDRDTNEPVHRDGTRCRSPTADGRVGEERRRSQCTTTVRLCERVPKRLAAGWKLESRPPRSWISNAEPVDMVFGEADGRVHAIRSADRHGDLRMAPAHTDPVKVVRSTQGSLRALTRSSGTSRSHAITKVISKSVARVDGRHRGRVRREGHRCTGWPQRPSTPRSAAPPSRCVAMPFTACRRAAAVARPRCSPTERRPHTRNLQARGTANIHVFRAVESDLRLAGGRACRRGSARFAARIPAA